VTGSGPTYVYRYRDWTGWGDRLAVARESGGDPGVQDAQNAAMKQRPPSPAPALVPLQGYTTYPESEMLARAVEFADDMQRRRTVRHFSDRPVPRRLVEECLRAAVSAPSGANQQPWRFVAVSDPAIKRRIREGAEAEEREFYAHRAPPDWLEAIAPLGTDADKPFLEVAPWLVAVFIRRFERRADGRKVKHYYTDESVGLATGLFLAACQQAGLATLTHTPSPMGFLNEILGRPKDLERPFLLLVVGYPAAGARVPDIPRRPVADVTTFVE
jgi:iodotyrosine deiodinase